MEELLAKSAGFLLLIGLGFGGKKVGLFRVEDRFVLSKVMLYITMPCLFISFFEDFEPAPTLILMFVLGIAVNFILCYTGLFFARHKSGTEKALYMLNCSGHNIGAFAIPIIATLFPPAAVIATSMYDIGNSIMSAGGTYALAANYTDKERGMRWSLFFRRLFSSVPFDTYLIMVVLSLLHVRFPAPVYEVAGMIGAPTVILTMIMLGITFDVDIDRHDLGNILEILAIRLVGAFAIATFAWFFLPLSQLEKMVLYLILFAPIPSLTPNFCSKCGCKPSVYGALSSITVPISLIAMNIVMVFFQ